MTDITPKSVIERYRHAKEQRGVWESHWQRPFRDYKSGRPFSFFVSGFRKVGKSYSAASFCFWISSMISTAAAGMLVPGP